jgi:uncharacterized protein YuzE
MQIRYDADADVLFVLIRDAAPADAIQEPGEVIISYGEDGEPVSVEFLNASQRHLVQTGELSVTMSTGSTAVPPNGNP